MEKAKAEHLGNEPEERICPYCGQSSKTVFVHGHEQCVVCNVNIEPCCNGPVFYGEEK